MKLRNYTDFTYGNLLVLLLQLIDLVFDEANDAIHDRVKDSMKVLRAHGVEPILDTEIVIILMISDIDVQATLI